jgi:hypothetical protein
MKEEFWTKRDGTRIAVGDMDVEHLQNTLRMIIRNNRRLVEKHEELAFPEMTYFEWEDSQDAQAYRDLANPDIFFPLLEGGVHGSPELQERHGKGVFR